MNVSVRHTYPIDISIKSSKGASSNTPSTTEPFTAGRATPRLLFDFGVMASLMNPQLFHKPVLDFGAGTGWVSEFCVRMGLPTVAFDIHGDLNIYSLKNLNRNFYKSISPFSLRAGFEYKGLQLLSQKKELNGYSLSARPL